MLVAQKDVGPSTGRGQESRGEVGGRLVLELHSRELRAETSGGAVSTFGG